MAARAEHLVATFGFVNVCTATGARFRVRLEQLDGFHISGIAHVRIHFFRRGTFHFVAVRAREFLADAAFPGR